MTTTNSTQLFISDGTEAFPPNASVSINYDGFVLGGDLTTTPIYATISQSGISTTNANGFNILSKLNMNDQNIDNVNIINGTTDLTLSGSDIYTNTQGLQLNAGTYINLDCNAGNISLITNDSGSNIAITSANNTQITAVSGLDMSALNLTFIATDNIDLTATTGTIQFNSLNPTYFNLTTPNTADGVISVAEINRNNGDVSIISQNNGVYIEGTTGLSLNSNNGILILYSGDKISLDATTDLDMIADSGDINITSTSGVINAYSNIVMKDANEPTWNTELTLSGLQFDIGGTYNVTIDAEGGGVINTTYDNGTNTLFSSLSPSILTLDDGTIVNTITPTGITTNDNFSIISTAINGIITLTSDDKIILNSDTDLDFDATNDIYITANDDIILQSNGKGIILNGGDGVGGLNDISLTTQNATSVGNIIMNSGGDIQITSSSNANMTAPSGLYVNIVGTNVGDGQVYCSQVDSGVYNLQISTQEDLIFIGTNIQSNSRGGSSGQYLRIKLNGTYYKIFLYDD